MWRSPVTVTGPATKPVTLAQAKAELRIDDTDDDTRIERYIAAACEHVEAVTGLRLVAQTVDLKCDGWADLERLPVAPVQTITSITYLDTAGASQTLAGSVYEVRVSDLMPSIVLAYGQSWPVIRTGSQITVRAVLGYAVQPDQIASAILIIVRVLNDQGTLDDVAPTVRALLVNHATFAVA